MVPCIKWGGETQKFGITEVGKDQLSLKNITKLIFGVLALHQGG